MGKEVYTVEAYSVRFFPIYHLSIARMTEFGLMEDPALVAPSLTVFLHAKWQGQNHHFLLPFLFFPPAPLPAEEPPVLP